MNEYLVLLNVYFDVRNLANINSKAGVYRVSDSVWLNQHKITDVPGPSVAVPHYHYQ